MQDTSGPITAVDAIIVMALAIVLIVVIPRFFERKMKLQQNTCVANLQKIELAKKEWYVRHDAGWLDNPPMTTNFGREFVCPAGGTYLVGARTNKVTCSYVTNITEMAINYPHRLE